MLSTNLGTKVKSKYRRAVRFGLKLFYNVGRPQKEDGTVGQSFPTPEEFLLYVLECLVNDGEDANSHWLPQYTSCPFCAANFTVYSKMEEMTEDTAYIMHKAKLFGKILPDLKVR